MTECRLKGRHHLDSVECDPRFEGNNAEGRNCNLDFITMLASLAITYGLIFKVKHTETQ